MAIPAGAQAAGQVTWRGSVDDTVIVAVHGRNVQTNTVSGKSTNDVRIQESGRLPHAPVSVYLQNWRGRGRVRIVQQPLPSNDFTAKVRIKDTRSGRSHYDFTLSWQGGPEPGAPYYRHPRRRFRGAVGY
jgi:hypothetical protein